MFSDSLLAIKFSAITNICLLSQSRFYESLTTDTP